MAIAHEFVYHRAASLHEAVDVLTRAGPGAWVLAGGTDLVPWLRDDAVHPELVVDIKGVPGLSDITVEDRVLRLGPLVTFTELIESKLIEDHLPLLAEMAETVASLGVRNRASVVGNICSAVPSCDSGPALLVLEADIEMLSAEGTRSVSITGWFTGPRATVRRPGEVVTGITIPLPEGEHGGVYLKLQRYEGEDLSQAGVAILALEGNRYRVAFGAVGPVPSRAPSIEAHLEGSDLTAEAIAGAKALVGDEISPITDMRATKEYRARMCEVMLGRGLEAAVSRRDGTGPAYGTRLV